MKDLGDTYNIMRITRISDEFVLSQSHYIKNILENFEYSPMRVPVNVNLHLTK
jgi:hypothetical protein